MRAYTRRLEEYRVSASAPRCFKVAPEVATLQAVTAPVPTPVVAAPGHAKQHRQSQPLKHTFLAIHRFWFECEASPSAL